MKRTLLSLLLFGFLGFSFEEDPIAVVKTKSENYFSQFKRAKLSLAFNQPHYAPGDTVRFSTLYVSAGTLKPMPGREIIHLCLFDQFGKKQLTRWTDVINGYASNEMVIPKEFSSGSYTFIAFTDWMKNFDPSLFFQQEFKVAGRFSMNRVSPKDTLMFFPEGGSLVAKTENNLAIRYTGGSSIAKVIINEGEKELTSLQLIKDSVYLFRFTPKLETRYSAEIETGERRFTLPSVKSSGITVNIDVTGSRIKLDAGYSGNDNSDKENFYTAVFNNNGLIFQSKLNFGGEDKSTLLLPATLPKGIAQLIVFDSKFNLAASRVIHIGGIENKEVSLGNLEANYGTRQEVNLDLEVRDKDGLTMPGFYSCRIVNEEMFKNSAANEMDYLTFQSDISNSFGLGRAHATQQTINNYLITQSCPWFVWNNIIKSDQRILFKPQQHLTLSGTVTYAKNGKHVADSTLIMFFLEKGLLGYETRTDKKGNFSFPLLLTVNHPDRFYYTATLKGKDVDDIAVQMHDPDSSLSFFANPWSVDRDSFDQYGSYSAQVQTINSSYSFFANPMPGDSVQEPNQAMEEELNGADLTVNLSDYLQMPTMEEVVREIVRAVEYRKIGGRQVVRVYTIGKVTNYSSGPLFVIDGVITKDPSYFLGLKPADVISIKIVRDVKKLFALGSLGANGVILVKTKLRTKIVKEKHTFDFVGLLPESHHSYFGYANSNQPDLRPCLFWTSKSFNGRGSASLHFKTSDDVGKFKVQISGLMEDGTPFYSEHPFQIKYQSH